MTDSVKLMPCPFCGDANKVKLVYDAVSYLEAQHVVVCSRCGAYGPNRNKDADAITDWNTRRAPDVKGVGDAVQQIKEARNAIGVWGNWFVRNHIDIGIANLEAALSAREGNDDN